MRMHAPSSSTSSSLSYTKESRVHAMFDAPLLNCIRRHSIRACVLPYIHCAPIQFASRRINQNVEPAKQQQQFETRAFAICFMGLLLRTFLIVNPVFLPIEFTLRACPKRIIYIWYYYIRYRRPTRLTTRKCRQVIILSRARILIFVY